MFKVPEYKLAGKRRKPAKPATSPSTTPSGADRPKLSSVRAIVESPTWRKILRALQRRRDWLDRVHVELTEIPAPTFQESARAAYLAERFRELGLHAVHTDSAGNVLGQRTGIGNQFLCLTAHLDTVVPPGVPVQVQRSNGRLYAPGISDNGAGLAALLGVAAALQESGIATEFPLLFVANVGEEGEGDLYGMRHLLAQPETRRRITGVLVLDGSAIDHIITAGLGSRRFLVEISGPGGHSWSNFGRVNPVLALATAINHLSGIRLPATPRTSLNIGMIQGGTTVNSIPSSAWMKVDIRSDSAEELDRLSRLLETAVQAGIEQENQHHAGTVAARIVPIGNRPAATLPPTARLLQVMQEVDQYLGIRSRLECASTDANIPLSFGLEAIATGGGGCGGEAHTPHEWFSPQGRELGLKRLLLAILTLATILEEPAI